MFEQDAPTKKKLKVSGEREKTKQLRSSHRSLADLFGGRSAVRKPGKAGRAR